MSMAERYSYIPCSMPHVARVDEARRVNVKKNRYPYCLVWTPLPVLSWLLPFVGHIGIGDSEGIVFDFSGPYTVGVDNFPFGKPARYLQLDPELASLMSWDEAVNKGVNFYETQMHIIVWNNCHSFITHTLNLMDYDTTHWNSFKIGWVVFWDAAWCDQFAMLRSFGCFWVWIGLLFLWGVVYR